MKTHSHLIVVGIFALALILLVGQAPETRAQGPQPPSPQVALGRGFTYQGQLKKNGVLVNDTCNFTFTLWDSPSNATGQVGGAQTINGVTVTNGYFMVVLNDGNQFGASAFTGQARWLQMVVKCTRDSAPFTLPRQRVTTAPYALFASAPWVTSGNNLYYNRGNVSIGTTSPGANARLHVIGGAFAIGSSPGTADAAIHVTSSFGGLGRLLQMSPSGPSQPGLNLLASTNPSGNAQWWAWGVTPEGKWRIQNGTAFGGSEGLTIDAAGDVGIGSVLTIS
jgi:hypothetical protein